MIIMITCLFDIFQSLTHLTITFSYNYFFIKNDLLKNIDIYLPKLRVLRILAFGSIEVSENTVNSLGRLSRLESIEFNVNNKSIRDLIIDKIMKNCRKIKSIDIRQRYMN